MIKSKDYMQLVQFLATNVVDFIEKNDDGIDAYTAIKRLDNLKKLNSRLQTEFKNWDVYPHKDLKIIELFKEEITNLCNEYKIKVTFVEKGTQAWKDGIYVYYNYKVQCLNPLIVFNNK